MNYLRNLSLLRNGRRLKFLYFKDGQERILRFSSCLSVAFGVGEGGEKAGECGETEETTEL